MNGRRTLLFAAVGFFICARTCAAYEESAAGGGGRIEGHVHVVGAVPKLPPQDVYKHQEFCGHSIADERLLVGKGGALRNAVVALRDVKAGKAIDRDHDVVLDNRKCAFVPHVLSATRGQTLAIRNDDPFLHDAHAWLGTRTLFNRAIMKGHTVRQPLEDAGLIYINCNVRHTWMHGYVYVAEHPYHTVTGADGAFVLDGVPPGNYTLTVWHEMLGGSDREVSVSDGQVSRVDFELSAEAKESDGGQGAGK